MKKLIILITLFLILSFISCDYYMDILVGNNGGEGITIKIEFINKPSDVDIIELAFLTSFEYDNDFISLDEYTREWLWPDVSDFDGFIDEHYEFGGDFSDGNPMINYIEPDIHSWLIYYEFDGPEGIESLILRAYYKDINNMDSFIFEEGIEYKIVVDLTEHLVVSIDPNQNDDVTRFHNVYATINDSNDYYGLLYNNIDQSVYRVDNTGDSLTLTDIFVIDGSIYLSANKSISAIDTAYQYMCSIEYGALNCTDTDLSMGSYFSQANSISIDLNNNSVVYIAGLYEDPNTAGNYLPCLWKNADALERIDLDPPIDLSSFNYVSSMFIEGDSIYITGLYYYDNGNDYGYSPINWSCKSDNCSINMYLQSSDFDYYIPTSIISEAGNVYVSLTRNNNASYQAYYWDENNSNIISDNGKTTDIQYTENQNLYIVGQYVDANDPTLSTPAYWRGDPLEVIKLSVDYNGLATSLHVITDNEGNEYLYIGGYIEDTATAGFYKAVYWKVDVSDNYFTEMYEILDSQNNNINVADMYFDSSYYNKPVSIFVEQD